MTLGGATERRAAVAAALIWAGLAQAQGPPKVKVRPVYEDGRALRYNLKLSGATAWAPTAKGLRWGKMQTDFTFVLATKAVRTAGLHKGSCTFRLGGEHLRSTGQGPEGAFGVDATRTTTRAKVKDRWQVTVQDRSPLRKDMTLTLGPLGGVRFGTGLAPIAIYFLPHVDHRFWTLLTVAPVREVAPGDGWEQDFDLPVPGTEGKPLELTGRWQVEGWESYRGRRVLGLTLSASMRLADTNLRLRNGDLIHVVSGSYQADGKAQWDVDAGVLCFATASQKLLATADKPSKRALRHEAECTLKLLAANAGK